MRDVNTINWANAIVRPQRMLLRHDLGALHRDLTDINSVTGNENAVGEYLSASLLSQGYHVEKQYVDYKAGRFNVYAYPGHKRETKLLVTSHMDTVRSATSKGQPPVADSSKVPPYFPYHIRQGLITGRGSVDDKASLAAQIVAVNSLLLSRKLAIDDVALLFVVGEETGGDGMRAANELGLRPQVVIFGEPTDGKLVSGHKGNLGLQITAQGKSVHSGYPWLGRSANEVLIKAVTALMELELELPTSKKYGASTINIGRIEGGVASNVVAERASADIAIRIAAGDPAFIRREVEGAVRHAMQPYLDEETRLHDVIELKFPTSGYGPVDIDHDVAGFDVTTVNYGTDIHWLKSTVDGQKRYLYGPGSILVAHSEDEGLKVTELSDGVDGYERIICSALHL